MSQFEEFCKKLKETAEWTSLAEGRKLIEAAAETLEHVKWCCLHPTIPQAMSMLLRDCEELAAKAIDKEPEPRGDRPDTVRTGRIGASGTGEDIEPR
jgi:hypothetical protein